MMEQQFHIDQIDLDIKERLLSAEKAAKLKGDIIIRMTEEKLNTELANNKVILNQIVEYQQEIALEILKKWRDEELEKLK